MLPKIIVYFALLATAVAFVAPQRACARVQPRHVASVPPVDFISASDLPVNNLLLAASESDFGGQNPASENMLKKIRRKAPPVIVVAPSAVQLLRTLCVLLSCALSDGRASAYAFLWQVTSSQSSASRCLVLLSPSSPLLSRMSRSKKGEDHQLRHTAVTPHGSSHHDALTPQKSAQCCGIICKAAALTFSSSFLKYEKRVLCARSIDRERWRHTSPADPAL